MTLENLIGKGLVREPANAEEMRRFLAKIETKLADANATVVSLDSRFDLAYEALLQIGLKADLHGSPPVGRASARQNKP